MASTASLVRTLSRAYNLWSLHEVQAHVFGGLGCWVEFFGHRVCEGNGICFFFVWICVCGCYFYGKYTYDEAVKTELAKERLRELSSRKAKQ